MAYKKDTDYQALINDAVSKGDYASASRYEKERNEKIDAENLSYEKTNKYNIPLGVSDQTYNQMNSTFNQGDASKNKDNVSNQAFANVGKLTNKNQIVSDDVWDAVNSKFVVPEEVKQADAWLSSQLEKIQSGKTSYSDQVRDVLNQIMNREKFSYDVDNDQLFQQALASAMNSGNQAMQDTIGQASALTGGYGSTYATTAGNQAYNAFIEDAYDNLPQYYQMAMEAYQMETEDMYRQFGMVSELDDKEFNRNLSAYDATYNHRNQLWNEAYTQHRDSVNDAFNMANLQINEHGQLVSDAYNYYNAASNEADKQYQRDYNAWMDSVNLAIQQAGMQSSDAWNQKNFDEGVRQYEQNYAQAEEQFKQNMEFQDKWNQKNFDEGVRQFNAQMAQKSSSGGGGGSGGKLKSPTETQMKNALEAYNKEGNEGFNKYVNSLPDTYDKEAIVQYIGQYGELPYSQRTYTITDDGGNNWGWGIDNDAKVKDEYGNEYTLKQLKEYDEDIAKELSKKSYKVGSTYTKK